MPFTIPLHSIFRMESIEMCPKRACQTSSEVLAVMEHVMLAKSEISEEVMYAFSVATTLTGSQYRPSSRLTTASFFKDKFRIWQLLSMKYAWAPVEVSCGMDRRLCEMLGQYRMLQIMVTLGEFLGVRRTSI